MKIKFDDSAIKDLSKLNKKTSSKIISKIELLSNFPNSTNIKKLTNHYPPYRLRVADYRILFDVENDLVTIYKIKHRKDSYKWQITSIL